MYGVRARSVSRHFLWPEDAARVMARIKDLCHRRALREECLAEADLSLLVSGKS
jgi:hypothetical protein